MRSKRGEERRSRWLLEHGGVLERVLRAVGVGVGSSKLLTVRAVE